MINSRKGRENYKTYIYTITVKTQIDSIIKKWINSALNPEAYSSFEGVSSDHRIVIAKIRLSLHRSRTQTTKTTHYDLSLFNNRDISYKYTITLKNKFDALKQISETLTPNDKYENFVITLMEATEYIVNKESNIEFHGRH